MNFNQLKDEYFQRYNNDCYGDSETKTMLDMISMAEQFSDEAKAQFADVFNMEFALDNELHFSSEKIAYAKFSALVLEAKNAGIRLTAGRGIEL